MSLRYVSRPYGGGRDPKSSVDQMLRQLPADAQPMASAPTNSATPIVVYDKDAKPHWALYHRNGWQKLAPFKDSKDQSTTWRMNGDEVSQAIAWKPGR
jgi:hypothetical protein